MVPINLEIQPSLCELDALLSQSLELPLAEGAAASAVDDPLPREVCWALTQGPADGRWGDLTIEDLRDLAVRHYPAGWDLHDDLIDAVEHAIVFWTHVSIRLQPKYPGCLFSWISRFGKIRAPALAPTPDEGLWLLMFNWLSTIRKWRCG